ncbi:hypothetical protein DXG03_000701 [Asterophora parasitica]|uniref:Uncharacterized protein n=1 Tax=Asterophora parasitica TaxID=117018 RepID=A0A9P7G452_9AGAR|nr:hypothetical protein DXG03_000701 [Asterophora parasitica]
MSDHRPVAADFFVDVDFFDKETHVAHAQKLYRTVERMDLSERTIIKFDDTSINMGKLSYGRPTSQTMRLQNIGKVHRLSSLDVFDIPTGCASNRHK